MAVMDSAKTVPGIRPPRGAVPLDASSMRAPMSVTASVFQGLLYAAIVFGVLLLIMKVTETTFDGPYRVLASLAALLVFGTMRRINIAVPWRTGRRGSPGSRMLLRWCGVFAVLLMVGYLTRYSEYFSRTVVLSWLLAAPVALLTTHAAVQWLTQRTMPELAATRRSVIVFVNDAARDFVHRIQTSRAYEVHGFFDDRDLGRIGGGIGEMKHLGHTSELVRYVRDNNIDVVFVVLPVGGSHRAVSLFESLGDTTASVYFVPDFDVFSQFETRVHSVESTPVLEIVETPIYGVDGLLKQVFDFCFAAFAVALTAIPMLAIAAMVKWTSPGPVFFKQTRYGLNGKEFWVYKFRSMYVGDVKVSDSQQATRDDPRVTPIGRILRRTSLDELPQFLNVLKGEMSVVGPRPHTVAHNEYYRSQVRRYMNRHKVKPGVTGLAQICGLRGETAQLERMEERIRLDLVYIRNWSLWFDITIIARTVAMIFKDDNAY